MKLDMRQSDRVKPVDRGTGRERFAGWPCASVLLLAVVFILTTAACASLSKKEMEKQKMAEQWGIEISSIRMTAGDHMIDFRYRVLDAEKAKTLLLRENKPYLIDEASGNVLTVPNTAKIGPLRNSGNAKEGRIYWMLFRNIPGLVKSGSSVSVVIGDFRADKLIVQ